MKDSQYLYVLLAFGFLIAFLFALNRCNIKCGSKDNYDYDDIREKVIKELNELLSDGAEIPEVTTEELDHLKDKIMAFSHGNDHPIRENLVLDTTQQMRNWPYSYYSFPYTQKYQGAWPPGLFSNLKYISPGFYTGSGQSWAFRPGIEYKYYQRGRWVRHQKGGNKHYYYLTNMGDFTHNAANYADTPLQFHS